MSVMTLSSREFNQDTSKAKKAARRGPVIITDRGRPAHASRSMHRWRCAKLHVPARLSDRDALIASTALGCTTWQR